MTEVRIEECRFCRLPREQVCGGQTTLHDSKECREELVRQRDVERAWVDRLVALHWAWDSTPPDTAEESTALNEIDVACRRVRAERERR